jgi:KaiC/GvpD/RAD55 family RecA-like ATPase
VTQATPDQLVRDARARAARPPVNGTAHAPSSELMGFLEGVSSGAISAIPWPWQKLHELTRALMPGTVTTVCGDPGVGKTYFALDCIRFWTEKGVDSAAFFVEKDRKFYLRRILAQQEGDSRYNDPAWLRAHDAEWRAAMTRHKTWIDALGERITVEGTGKPACLRSLKKWVEVELAAGRRILLIDPITAADPGSDRPWEADRDFMIETQKLLTRYGASLILVTHPRKGNVTKKTGHDVAGGAAYFRFADTSLWIERFKQHKRFDVWSIHGPTVCDTDIVIQIHKARESKGTGRDLAMTFGDGLHFAEAGVILRESQERPNLVQLGESVPDPFPPVDAI